MPSAEATYDPFFGFTGTDNGASGSHSGHRKRGDDSESTLGSRLVPVDWEKLNSGIGGRAPLPTYWISFDRDGALVPGVRREAPVAPSRDEAVPTPVGTDAKKNKKKRSRDGEDDGEDADGGDADEAEPSKDQIARRWRKDNAVTVFGGRCPPPVSSFAEAAHWLPPAVMASFQTAGFSAPTPIQAQAWPILLANRDLVGIAKTGSGKTLAFIVPAILHILVQEGIANTDSAVRRRDKGGSSGKTSDNNSSGKASNGPIALVLAPTRELAQQIEQEAVKVVPSSLTCLCIYGGSDHTEQLKRIGRGAQLVVATPGRLIDLIERRRLSLVATSFLVLDEADRMLDMGFEPQVRALCTQLRPNRHTMMFSATWPPSIQALASSFLTDFVRLHVGSTRLRANADVQQTFALLASPAEKLTHLGELLTTRLKGKHVLVFAKTRVGTDALERSLRQLGVRVAALHGDKDQQEREYIINKFRVDRAMVLVATDVAARGLDVKLLDTVVNYDFPMTLDDYVHRIGRTGRAGARGEAVTLIVRQTDRHLTPQVAKALVRLVKGATQEPPAWLVEWSELPPKPPTFRKQSGNGPVIPYKSGVRPSTSSPWIAAAAAATAAEEAAAAVAATAAAEATAQQEEEAGDDAADAPRKKKKSVATKDMKKGTKKKATVAKPAAEHAPLSAAASRAARSSGPPPVLFGVSRESFAAPSVTAASQNDGKKKRRIEF